MCITYTCWSWINKYTAICQMSNVMKICIAHSRKKPQIHQLPWRWWILILHLLTNKKKTTCLLTLTQIQKKSILWIILSGFRCCCGTEHRWTFPGQWKIKDKKIAHVSQYITAEFVDFRLPPLRMWSLHRPVCLIVLLFSFVGHASVSFRTCVQTFLNTVCAKKVTPFWYLSFLPLLDALCLQFLFTYISFSLNAWYQSQVLSVQMDSPAGWWWCTITHYEKNIWWTTSKRRVFQSSSLRCGLQTAPI